MVNSFVELQHISAFRKITNSLLVFAVMNRFIVIIGL
jgi:hypothetical protein